MEEVGQMLFGGLPDWIRQLWHLQKADVLWLTGKHSEAIRSASAAIELSGGQLLSDTYVGAFARWVAMSGRANSDKTWARDRLQQLLDPLQSYDVLDQLETVCSVRMIDVQSGSWDLHSERCLQERLGTFPSAVRDHLKRLDMLTPF
jgi:hypothetical protein